MKWIRFKKRFPSEDEFPIWKYQKSFRKLSFYRNRQQLGTMPRPWCIADDIFWKSLEFKKPEPPYE